MVPQVLNKVCDIAAIEVFELAGARHIDLFVEDHPARPGTHDINRISEIHRFTEVMGHQHDCAFSVIVQRLQYIPQLFAGKGIKRAKGFIEQQEFRLVHQGTAELGTLLHTTGKLPGRAVAKPFKPDRGQQLVGDFFIMGLV